MTKTNSQDFVKERTSSPQYASNSEDASERILSIATEMFLECGFDATNLNDIARRSGVSKRAIYTNFGDKEGLFRHSIEKLSGELVQHIEQDLPQDDVQEALRQYSLKIVEISLDSRKRALYWLVTSEARRFTEIADLFRKNGYGHVNKKLTSLFSHYCALGQLKPMDPALLARQFLGMLAGTFDLNPITVIPSLQKSGDLNNHINQCISTFLEGAGSAKEDSAPKRKRPR